MTRFALFLFFFVILTPKALSQPPLAWAGQLEKKNIWSYWSGAVAAVDVDKAGSMCVVGKFSDSIDFDPSSSNFYLKTSGNSAFIAKYSSTGKLLWAKDIATQGYGGLSIST